MELFYIEPCTWEVMIISKIKTELLHRRRKEASELDFNDELPFMGFVCAQVVSIVACTMCYPIDSGRKRLMMKAEKPLAERKYMNSLHAFRRIFIDEGIGGFYLGIGPNLFRSKFISKFWRCFTFGWI